MSFWHLRLLYHRLGVVLDCRTHQNKDLCLSADVGICPKDVMSIEMNIATCNLKYVAVFVITIHLLGYDLSQSILIYNTYAPGMKISYR